MVLRLKLQQVLAEAVRVVGEITLPALLRGHPEDLIKAQAALGVPVQENNLVPAPPAGVIGGRGVLGRLRGLIAVTVQHVLHLAAEVALTLGQLPAPVGQEHIDLVGGGRLCDRGIAPG